MMNKIGKILLLILCLSFAPDVFCQIPDAPEIDGDSYSFAIVADRFGGEKKGIFSQILDNINGKNPAFIMSVGDLINGHTTNIKNVKRQWSEFDELISVSTVPFFPTAGNHDVCTIATLSEWICRYEVLYYSFKIHDDLYCILSSDYLEHRGYISQRQADYFISSIADSGAGRVFLFMHTPLWKKGDQSGMNEILEALKGKEFYIFSGHEHRFQQLKIDNNQCYVMGTSGGDVDLSLKDEGEIFHYFYVTVSKDNVIIENRDVDDNLL